MPRAVCTAHVPLFLLFACATDGGPIAQRAISMMAPMTRIRHHLKALLCQLRARSPILVHCMSPSLIRPVFRAAPLPKLVGPGVLDSSGDLPLLLRRPSRVPYLAREHRARGAGSPRRPLSEARASSCPANHMGGVLPANDVDDRCVGGPLRRQRPSAGTLGPKRRVRGQRIGSSMLDWSGHELSNDPRGSATWHRKTIPGARCR